MQLDFTAVWEEPTEKPAEGRREDFKASDGAEQPAEDKTPRKSLTEAHSNKEQAGKLLNTYILEKENNERYVEVCKAYQDNIKASEILKAEILKELKEGQDFMALFLKASQCIALMTGEEAYYNQVENDIVQIYGAALLEPKALQMDLEKTGERLQKLQTALEKQRNNDSIRKAVEAHKQRTILLKELIKKAEAQQ